MATVVSVSNYIYRLLKPSATLTGDNCELKKCGYCNSNFSCKKLITGIKISNNFENRGMQKIE